MTYRELEFFEKTFDDFILKQKKKNEVKIEYYLLQYPNREYHCSFIGYATNGGKHGVHYNRTRNKYFFGHLNPTTGSIFLPLNPRQEIKIPSKLKDGLLNVANNRLGAIVKKQNSKNTF